MMDKYNDSWLTESKKKVKLSHRGPYLEHMISKIYPAEQTNIAKLLTLNFLKGLARTYASREECDHVPKKDI